MTAPVNDSRAPEDAGRVLEDDDGATVDTSRALFILHKNYSENQHELLFRNNIYYIK
jgi:hypothetical protein